MSEAEDRVRVQLGLKPKKRLPQPDVMPMTQEERDLANYRRLQIRPIQYRLEQERNEPIERMIREQHGLEPKWKRKQRAPT